MILLLLLILVNPLPYSQFHLERTINLPGTYNITRITNIDNIKLGILQADPTNSSLTIATILSGNNYENKVKQLILNTNSLASVPKFSGQDIILNYGTNITFDSQKINRKWQYNSSYLHGNIIVTSKYALIVQQLGCPTLMKLDLTTMQLSNIQIQSGPNCTISKWSYLRDLQNGKILFASIYTVYILNNETFKIQQKIQNLPFLCMYATSYSDPITEQSIVLISRDAFNEYLTLTLDPVTNLYKQSSTFTMTGLNITLTGMNSAVTLCKDEDGYTINKIRRLRNSYIAIDFMTSNQSLLSKSTQAINKQENKFVTFSTQTGSLTLYTFNQQFKIQNISQIKLPNFKSINSAKFTDNSQYLLVLNNLRIYRISTDTLNYTALNQTKSCLNLNLIKNKQDINNNYFIVSCIQTRNGTKYAIVQLRSNDDLSLIDEYEINMGKTLYEIRILSNQYWEEYFSLVIKTSFGSTDPATIMLMKIQDSKIVNTDIQTTALKYDQIQACHKYIVGFPANDENYLRIYHHINLTVAHQIYYSLAEYSSYYDILTQGDVLIVETMASFNSYYNTDFYILSSSKGNWYQGSLQRQYYKQSIKKSTAVRWMIFAKRRLYYLYTTSTIGTMYPIKLIYNVSDPPIAQKIPVTQSMPIEMIYRAGTDLGQFDNYTQMSTQMSKQSTQSRQSVCNSVFFHQSLSQYFYRHQDCAPMQPTQEYPCNSSNRSLTRINFIQSSNPKYLIMLYNNKYQIDIRQSNNPNIRVWYLNPSIPINSAQIIGQNKIIINYKISLHVHMLRQNQYSNLYNISKISVMDINSNGSYVFVGPIDGSDGNHGSETGRNMSRIVYKENINANAKLIDTNGTVVAIGLSESAEYVVITDGIIVTVYDTNTLASVYEEEFVNATDVEFVNEDTLLVRINASIFRIVKFLAMSTQAWEVSQQLEYSGNKAVVSKDGQFIAYIVNSTAVQLMTNSREIIVVFNLQNVGVADTIADVIFMDNNTLLVASSSRNVYSLSPTPCPSGYVNKDTICLCAQNSTEVQNKCQCNHNFVALNNTCLCPQTFEYKQLQCHCSGYSENNICFNCDAFCETCTGSGLNCITYGPIFYGIIIGSCVLVILIVLAVVLIIRRKRLYSKIGEDAPLVQDQK